MSYHKQYSSNYLPDEGNLPQLQNTSWSPFQSLPAPFSARSKQYIGFYDKHFLDFLVPKYYLVLPDFLDFLLMKSYSICCI